MMIKSLKIDSSVKTYADGTFCAGGYERSKMKYVFIVWVLVFLMGFGAGWIATAKIKKTTRSVTLETHEWKNVIEGLFLGVRFIGSVDNPAAECLEEMIRKIEDQAGIERVTCTNFPDHTRCLCDATSFPEMNGASNENYLIGGD